MFLDALDAWSLFSGVADWRTKISNVPESGVSENPRGIVISKHAA